MDQVRSLPSPVLRQLRKMNMNERVKDETGHAMGDENVFRDGNTQNTQTGDDDDPDGHQSEGQQNTSDLRHAGIVHPYEQQKADQGGSGSYQEQVSYHQFQLHPSSRIIGRPSAGRDGWDGGTSKKKPFSGCCAVRSVVEKHKYIPKMYMKLMLPPASLSFFSQLPASIGSIFSIK